jgi:putative oxidoreductase
LQRLFSTFASGWPGLGLLLLRLLTGAAVLFSGIVSLRDGTPFTIVVLHIIGAVAAILLLIGLWTPVAGGIVVVVKALVALSGHYSLSGGPWIPIMQAVLGAILAMLGPGAWSIDARLFGRKRINFPEF